MTNLFRLYTLLSRVRVVTAFIFVRWLLFRGIFWRLGSRIIGRGFVTSARANLAQKNLGVQMNRTQVRWSRRLWSECLSSRLASAISIGQLLGIQIHCFFMSTQLARKKNIFLQNNNNCQLKIMTTCGHYLTFVLEILLHNIKIQLFCIDKITPFNSIIEDFFCLIMIIPWDLRSTTVRG